MSIVTDADGYEPATPKIPTPERIEDEVFDVMLTQKCALHLHTYKGHQGSSPKCNQEGCQPISQAFDMVAGLFSSSVDRFVFPKPGVKSSRTTIVSCLNNFH